MKNGFWAGLFLSILTAGGAMAGVIEGSAGYRERIAVLPGSVLQVELLDVSKADAPAEVLSSRRYALKGVPAAFELHYDDALIDERMRYVLRAEIRREGRLLFTTDTSYPVLTQGAGNAADLMLVKVSAPVEARLEGSEWVMQSMRDMDLIPERLPEIGFTEDGAFFATGGCNRLRGAVTIGADSLEFPDAIAGTMMACPEEVEMQESAFLDALAMVAGYALDQGELVLMDGQGDEVMRFTPKG
ncbi:YbaY family lipoprotein [Cribrihabitans sp. XS_ASV171]